MDVLAVAIDRRHVDRVFGTVVAALALPAVLAVVLAVVFVSMGATYAVVLFAIPLVGMLPLVVAECVVWAATRRIDHPLVLSTQGLAFDTPRGSIAFCWEAVSGVWVVRRLLGRQLVVQLHPQAGPGSPGVVSTLTPGGWRIVRRTGLRLSLRACLTSPDEIARAVEHLSRGRCQVGLAG